MRKRFPALDFLSGEPMSRHVTFRTGGPADILAFPSDRSEFLSLVDFCRNEGIPLLVIGGGSNLLVADKGIRGVVLSTVRLNGCAVQDNLVRLGAGSVISDAALDTARRGLSGLHLFHGMPGSVGGAVFMNARCYDGEIADVFHTATVWTPSGLRIVPFSAGDWSYKVSPFQHSGIILEAEFLLASGDPCQLEAAALDFKKDREEKGHYRAPCAGSVFKNNRDFGEPSGKIIDRCGLKGLTEGGAAVAPWHANIIINTGGATSADILKLIRTLQHRVADMTGFDLEPEVIPVGDWEDDNVAGS